MKIIDLTEDFFTQEQYIQEVTNLFVAIGNNHNILSEATLDEAGVWDIIKKSAGGIWQGVKTANDAINKLGQIAQNTHAVENFDRKADQLIATVKGKLPDKTVEIIEKYRDWGLKNPKKQTVILAMLGAVSALALGPAGGAGVAGVLRFGNEMLKGERASTAIGRSTKSAVIGFGAGAIFSGLGELFGSPNLENIPGFVGIKKLTAYHMVNGQLISIEAFYPEERSQNALRMWRAATKYLREGDAQSAYDMVNRLRVDLAPYQTQEFLSNTFGNNDRLVQQAIDSSEKTKAAFNTIGSLLQGVITAKTEKPTNNKNKLKSAISKSKPPSAKNTKNIKPADNQKSTSILKDPAVRRDISAIKNKYPNLSWDQAIKIYNKRNR